MKKAYLLILLGLIGYCSKAQIKFGDNPGTIDPNSLLELESTNGGVLLPRLSVAQRDAMTSVPAGMFIYNTDDSCTQYFDGIVWECLVGETPFDAPDAVVTFEDTTAACASGTCSVDPNDASTHEFAPDDQSNGNNIYVGPDGDTWVWDGSSYVNTPLKVEPWWNNATRKPSDALGHQIFHFGSVNIGRGYSDGNSRFNLTVGVKDSVSGSNNIVSGHSNTGVSGNYNLVSGFNNNVITGFSNAVSGNSNDSITGNMNVITGTNNKNLSLNSGVVSGQLHNNLTGNNSVVFGTAMSNCTGSASVVGGYNNKNISSKFSLIVGSNMDTVEGSNVAVLGGNHTNIFSSYNLIGGFSHDYVATGNSNLITGNHNDSITGHANAVVGQEHLAISGNQNLVSGKGNAYITGGGNAVSGLTNETISGSYNIVSGRLNTNVSGDHNLVTGKNHSNIGGDNNIIGGQYNKNIYSTGYGNLVTGFQNEEIGGHSNAVLGYNAELSGTGANANNANIVSGNTSSLGFSADNNIVSGLQTTLEASCDQNIVVGHKDTLFTSSHNNAVFGDINKVTGSRNLVAGWSNTVVGGNSVALGRNCNVGHSGAFCLGDGSTDVLSSTAHNTFSARFKAGYRLFTNSAQTTGAALAANATTWTTLSDRRSKENIETLGYGLSTVMQLKPSIYNYKGIDNRNMGFIAQDVAKVVPEIVDTKAGLGPDGDYMGVRYTELIPVLTKAIQEQQAQIEELKSQVKELKSRK